jgi:hypothetical protein
MGKGYGAFGRRACLGACIASIALALCVPGIAFAANTATFGSAAPKSGSSTTATRPTISVSVHDRYGVKGSGSYSMTLDGKTVRPTISYSRRGDYSGFKLTYKVASNLSAARHTVVVKVKDLKRRSSSYTWSFTVLDTVAPVTTSDLALTYEGMASIHLYPTDNVSVAHTYYMLDGGPQTPYSGVISVPAVDAYTPLHTLEYWSVDARGNEEARHFTSFFVTQSTAVNHALPTLAADALCTLSGCHGTITGTNMKADLESIHAALGCAPCHAGDAKPTDDCTTCHGADGGHRPHPAQTASETITINSVDYGEHACSECHAADLPAIHGGVTSCVKCHPDPASSGTKGVYTCGQTGCHAATSTLPQHGKIDAAHTLSLTPSCIASTCHTGGTDVAAIHGVAGGPGCAACHGPGKTPSTKCSTCHAAGTYHLSAIPHHTVVPAACSQPGCHHTSGDVSVIHAAVGCAVCHNGKPLTTDCATVGCHPAPHTAAPLDASALHVAPQLPCISSGCHVTNVLVIHRGNCADCHGVGKTPSTNCYTCHSNAHANQSAAHVIADDCTASGCHQGSAATIHKDNCTRCHFQSYPASTKCADCHSTVDHTTLHDVSDRTDACAQCHAGTNLTKIHPTCSICHSSKDSAVVAAIAGHDKLCSACHAGHDLPALHASNLDVTTGTITVAGVGTATHSCSECHASDDLRTLHGEDGSNNSCAKCHTTDVKTTLGGDGTWGKGCTQGNCHAGTSTVPMHGSLSTAHVSDTAAQCTTGSCHGGGGVTNVAVIHSVVTGHGANGCGVCHDANPAHTPTLDCQAAGCHKDAFPPTTHAGHESTLTAGSIAITGLTTYTYSCSDCHASVDLQVLHTGCASCHGGANPAGSLPVGDYDCTQAGCHATGSTQPMHGTLGTVHTSAVAAGCTTGSCHGGGGVTNVAVIHSGVTGHGEHGCGVCHDANPAHIPNLDCQAAGCHKDAFPPATHGSHDSTLTSGSIAIAGLTTYTYNCSDCHASTDLQVLHTTGCATCHAGANPAGSLPAGDFDCTQAGCHAGGSSQPMHGALASVHSSDTAAGCTTGSCHGGGGVTNVAVIHSGVTGHGDHGCGVCHDANPDHIPNLDCQAAGCHQGAFPPATHGSHDTTLTSGTIAIVGVAGSSTYSCSLCHATTDLQVLHTTGCVTCHGGTNPAGALPAGDFDCTQVGCHAVGSTQPMHGDLATKHAAPAAAQCTTGSCHGGGGVTNVAVIHSVVTGHGTNGCAICHDSNPAHTPTLDCQSAVACHQGAFPPASHGSHDTTLTSGTIAIAGVAGSSTYSCSLCHATTDLQVLHTTGCVTCHGGTNPAGSLPAGDFDCTQVGCHAVGSSQPMHGTLGSVHTAAAAAGCTTGSCHGGGGVTNVAVIHSAVTGHGTNGCAICHDSNPAHTPTLDCQSAVACHQGAFPPATHAGHESTLTAGSIAVAGVGTSTYNCSDCHATNDLQVLHTSCATCHGGANPAGSLPKGDYDCTQAGCHAVGSSQPMHGGLTTAHTTTTTVGDPYNVAVGTSVAAIHSAVVGHGTNGCGSCHASGTPSTTCATCHTSMAAETSAHGDRVYNDCNGGGCHSDCEDSGCHDGWSQAGSYEMSSDLPSLHAGVKTTPAGNGWYSGQHTNGCLTCHTPGSATITPCVNCHNTDYMNSDYNGMG